MSLESLLHHLADKHKFRNTSYSWPYHRGDGSSIKDGFISWDDLHRMYHSTRTIAVPHRHGWLEDKEEEA